MLGCVIMAAGNAVRFGANKLEAELDGKPLIRRHSRPFRPEYSTASSSSRSIPPLQPSRGNSVSSRCATTGPATG